MNHYDIVIATPGSMITGAFVRSLAKTIEVLQEKNISWKFINYESCYIRYAREKIINDTDDGTFDSTTPFSGNFTYNKIMWIDSDIQWEPEHVLSLFYSDRDIITGGYMMVDGRIAVSFDEKTSPYPNQIPTSRQVEVSSCGFGFVCVKKGVFESMPRPWFDSKIFEKDGILVSGIAEDSAWCLKARNSGFKIWLDPSVRVIHNKNMSLAWFDHPQET